jgi:molecular chaperone DnaK (HSP70)
VPQIEVTFDIDANGIVNVSAKISAPARNRRSPSPHRAAEQEEVERMMKDANRTRKTTRAQEEIECAIGRSGRYGRENAEDMAGSLQQRQGGRRKAIEQLKGPSRRTTPRR